LPIPETPPPPLPEPDSTPEAAPETPETTQTSAVIPLELVIPGS
jgi:hypothetical protein